MPRAFLTRISARQWLTVLLGGVVCLASWQVWLTVRLLEQDQSLELQRSHEHLGEIADLALAQLSRRLGDWELGLHELNAFPPSPTLLARLPKGATFVIISQDGIKIYPQRPLLFTSAPPLVRAPTLGAFDVADGLELRELQYDHAIAALRPLTLRPATRLEAMLHVARIQNKSGLHEAALNTYQGLASETALDPSGTPYALLAASARCRILMNLGRHQEASTEADALRTGLLDGRWPLSREAFDYHWSELDHLGIAAGSPPKHAIDFSTLVAELYNRWQVAQASGTNPSGREFQPDSSLLIWNSTSNGLSALLTLPDWLDTTLKLPPSSTDVQWKLLSPGTPGGTGLTVMRSMADAQIPGRLEFASIRPFSSAASNRRTLLLGGAALMLLVILGSGYVVYRAISRELRVAHLQSDFVAAVSHEFRSPLTTLRTITELLAQNRISDEARRRQSYVFLDHETNRLHRLVEDLLDFGRMESGRKQYRLEPHDAFDLLRATVADFSEHAEAQGFSVEADLIKPEGASASIIRVDQEAFRRAVRNLLDNAVKYSPVCRTVSLRTIA